MHASHADPLALWEAELRAIVVESLPPERVTALTAAALGASITTAVAASASAAAAQGGTIMSITAAMGANAATKIAAGCLAATLAVGGSLAATGKLPDKAQDFSADAAAHVGITLPRSNAETSLWASLGAKVGTVIEVANAGHIGVTVDKDRLVLTGIEAKGAFTAHVVSYTDGILICEFRSADEIVTVVLTNVNGEVVASATTSKVGASVGAGSSGSAGITGQAGTGTGSTDVGTSGSANVGGSAGTSDSSDSDECGCESGTGAEAEAEAEVSISIRLGG